MRKHVDIVAIALLVALLAGGELLAPVMARHHTDAQQDIQLAMFETREELRRGAAEARMELLKARNEVVEETTSLHRDLAELPSCPLAR